MKFIIALTVLTVLAALAFAGCNQSASTGSTNTPATYSINSGASRTNLLATNSLPDVFTNVVANDDP